MPWTTIGTTNTGYKPHEQSWKLFSLALAKKYVEFVCGVPPEGCELDIMWNDHELGSYPSLGVWHEYSLPEEYINSCERAMEIFDTSISWLDLKKHFEGSLVSEQDSDNEEESGAPEEAALSPDEKWRLIRADKEQQEIAGLRFHCAVCGSGWKLWENIHTCKSCGVDYCIKCVWQLAVTRKDEHVDYWTCRSCGGQVV